MRPRHETRWTSCGLYLFAYGAKSMPNYMCRFFHIVKCDYAPSDEKYAPIVDRGARAQCHKELIYTNIMRELEVQ